MANLQGTYPLLAPIDLRCKDLCLHLFWQSNRMGWPGSCPKRMSLPGRFQQIPSGRNIHTKNVPSPKGSQKACLPGRLHLPAINFVFGTASRSIVMNDLAYKVSFSQLPSCCWSAIEASKRKSLTIGYNVSFPSVQRNVSCVLVCA